MILVRLAVRSSFELEVANPIRPAKNSLNSIHNNKR